MDSRTRWGRIRPLERADIGTAPDQEYRANQVEIAYSLVPTVRPEGTYTLSPVAPRIGFLPLVKDMPRLVDINLIMNNEIELPTASKYYGSMLDVAEDESANAEAAQTFRVAQELDALISLDAILGVA